jgi:CheY-like chemotaxis protein
MASTLMSITSAVTDAMQSEAIIDRSVSPAPASNGDHDFSGAPSPATSAGSTKASDWHILIVDDEPDIRKMLRDLLQFEGYTVSDAADGMIGLDQLRASPRPLIVLLDYKMPRMNGEELLQAVMADPQLAHRHAFIFVTANLPSFSPALHQLLADAAISVIQKPFQIAVILDEVERAIARLSASQGPPDPPAP